MLCKAVVSTVYIDSLFSIGVLLFLFNIDTALHNQSSSAPMLCKAVVSTVYIDSLFSLAFLLFLFNVGIALHNHSSSVSLPKKLDGQMTMNNL